jgi:hypothetical protein
VALALAVPLVPTQAIENVVVWLRVPVETEPEVACVPVQPPEAVQLVAFTELQVSVLEDPAVIVAGETVRVAVGAGVMAL